MEKDLDWWLKLSKHHICKIIRAPRFFLVLFICNPLSANAAGLLRGVGGTNREQKDQNSWGNFVSAVKACSKDNLWLSSGIPLIFGPQFLGDWVLSIFLWPW